MPLRAHNVFVAASACHQAHVVTKVRNCTRFDAAAATVTFQSTNAPPRWRSLPQSTNGLHPPKDLLDQLPLADFVARVASGHGVYSLLNGVTGQSPLAMTARFAQAVLHIVRDTTRSSSMRGPLSGKPFLGTQHNLGAFEMSRQQAFAADTTNLRVLPTYGLWPKSFRHAVGVLTLYETSARANQS